MLKALIREPCWLADHSGEGQAFHLNWIADVEDEDGRVIDLHASLGETLLMAAHCVDAAEQAWVWGTWWGGALEPERRRGAAGSLGEAQRAAIAAGLQMAELRLRTRPRGNATVDSNKKNSCHRPAEEGRLHSQSLWSDASFDRYRRS